MAVRHVTHIGPHEGGNYEQGWQGSYLHAQLLSDVGKKRQHNEDACALCAPEDGAAGDGLGVLAAVADGMGGASAGELASRMALEALVEGVQGGSMDNLPKALREAIEGANNRIFAESLSNAEYHGMGTTMSAVVVAGDWAYVGQVGDSRVYLGRGKGELHQVTKDHSVVAEQVRDGLISEEEARTHTLKNLITRAVGIKDTVKVDLFAFHLRRGDTVLICSDGLSNMVEDSEIAAALALDNLQGAARRLVGRALAEGGTDNVTTVLFRVTGLPPKTMLQEGALEVTLPEAGLLDKLKGLFAPS